MNSRRSFLKLLPAAGGTAPLLSKASPPALPQAHEIYKSFSAQDWAKAFVAHVKQIPDIATDEETMVAWFASALMRGYDEGISQERKRAKEDLLTGPVTIPQNPLRKPDNTLNGLARAYGSAF